MLRCAICKYNKRSYCTTTTSTTTAVPSTVISVISGGLRERWGEEVCLCMWAVVCGSVRLWEKRGEGKGTNAGDVLRG